MRGQGAEREKVKEIKGNEMKKKKGILLAVGCFALFVIGTVISYQFNKEVNIMDRIYKEATKDFTAFNNVPELQGLTYDSLHQFENFGGLIVPYKEEYVRENTEIELFFPTEGGLVEIDVHVQISETVLLNFNMSYDVKERVMTYGPIEIVKRYEGEEFGTHYEDAKNIQKYLDECHISREDVVEYHNYALYDVVMKTWVAANGGNYEREKERMQNCSLIDNSFVFAGE